jgi:ABC-2 type transport system permease protein
MGPAAATAVAIDTVSEVLTSQARPGKCVLLVLEEKSSRVVEVLLAAVPPTRLLAGKVLGIGLTVFLQASLAVVVALVLAHGVGSDVLHGTTTASIAATLVWLVLGYAFYAWVYAAAGSMASRQD